MAQEKHVAVRVPRRPNTVQLWDGSIGRESDAVRAGYTIQTEAEHKREQRLEAFIDLPEARGKIRSAMRLAHDYTAEAMPLDRARAFLLGAPTDAAIAAAKAKATKPTTTTTAADPRAARRAELHEAGRAASARR